MIRPVVARVDLHPRGIGNRILALARVFRNSQRTCLTCNPSFERARLFTSAQTMRADQEDAAHQQEQGDGRKRTG